MKTELTRKEKDIRNAYYRQWRRRNPDKVRQANKRYWQKKAAQQAASDSEASGLQKEVKSVSDL